MRTYIGLLDAEMRTAAAAGQHHTASSYVLDTAVAARLFISKQR